MLPFKDSNLRIFSFGLMIGSFFFREIGQQALKIPFFCIFVNLQLVELGHNLELFLVLTFKFRIRPQINLRKRSISFACKGQGGEGS